MEDAIIAYEQGIVDLHAWVWLRFDGPVEDTADPIEVIDNGDGVVTKRYEHRRVREDSEGNLLSQHLYTTPGRIIYNHAVHTALAS